MTENLNISGEQERKELDCAEAERAERKKSEYLAEAWRLLELKIDDQTEINDRLERKAFLLVTFAVAIIGYLFSTVEFSESCWLCSFLGIMSVLKIVLCVALGYVVWLGVRIFELKRFVGKGLLPKFVMHEFYNFDLDELRTDVLDIIDADINDGEKILEGKAEDLETGIKWLKWSMVSAFVLIVIEKFW